jgi:hypothetical protein
MTLDCPHCQVKRTFVRKRTPHVLHALASLFTSGLWLPIWAWRHNSRDYCCCEVCGVDRTARPTTLAPAPVQKRRTWFFIWWG